MADQTLESKFLTLCQRILDSLSSMIKDARDAKLSKCDPSQLDTTRNMLGLANPTDLIASFIGMRSYWKKIEKREISFLTEDVQKVFAQSGIDSSVLSEPIRVYLLLKEAKTKEPCINDEDIDTLWKRFVLMIKISCKYNAEHGNKIDLSEFNSRYL